MPPMAAAAVGQSSAVMTASMPPLAAVPAPARASVAPAARAALPAPANDVLPLHGVPQVVSTPPVTPQISSLTPVVRSDASQLQPEESKLASFKRLAVPGGLAVSVAAAFGLYFASHAHTPAELHALFQRHFRAGDLDALVLLYEPDAALAPQPGTVVHGRAKIRASLAAFLAMSGTFTMSPPRILGTDDVALVVADWKLDAKQPDGAPLRLAGQTADVVRRQANGHWLFAVDSPFGPAGAR